MMRQLIVLMALAATVRGESVREKLLGIWELTGYDLRAADGKVTYPFGQTPVGRIAYMAGGQMDAQLMRPGLAKFASDNRYLVQPAEAVAAMKGYMGYFGTFTVDEARGVVIHHVKGASFPNYVGTDQVRKYRFEGDRLTLEADTAAGQARVYWKRAR
ncbi:MAG: lipocalin-like domain-containing protein [Acidobacteria bacterium]|nr:lipocalin-like domain-containing protein [Acidobacteriota bacterium]